MTRILHVREQVRQDSLMFSSYGSHVVLHMVLFMVLHTVYVHGSTYSFFTWSYAWFLLLVLLIVYVHGSTIVSSYGFFSRMDDLSAFH